MKTNHAGPAGTKDLRCADEQRGPGYRGRHRLQRLPAQPGPGRPRLVALVHQAPRPCSDGEAEQSPRGGHGGYQHAQPTVGPGRLRHEHRLSGRQQRVVTPGVGP